MAYLSQLSVDVLKIDGSFVARLEVVTRGFAHLVTVGMSAPRRRRISPAATAS
jgi:EAL domain-containing protein (putative c-di-GMP-specific phosphodiesterase class I)